jgi:hypothetical protein
MSAAKSSQELYATDQTFAAVADLLFGGGGDQLLTQIAKMNPTQSDLATKDRKRRALTAGLSAVGATAGAAGLGYAGLKTRGAYRAARYGQDTLKAAKAARTAGNAAPKLQPVKTRRASAGAAVKNEKIGAALVPLEVAGLGGELMATKILHGDTRHGPPKKKSFGKAITEIPETAQLPKTKGQLTRAVVTNPKVRAKGLEYTKKGAGTLRRLPDKVKTVNTSKRLEPVEVVWSGEIAKADADKQQIFGWASVVEVDGEPVVDLQGDRISPDEMEKAAYSYVQKSRKGGDMHLRDNWEPIQKSEMIESFIVTDEKRQAMGLPGSVPTGWWVGFQVQDPQVWADVKSGKRTGFSIHGTGRRTPA